MSRPSPIFAAWSSDLAREHFKLVVITELHIARQRNVGYAPYDSAWREISL